MSSERCALGLALVLLACGGTAPPPPRPSPVVATVTATATAPPKAPARPPPPYGDAAKLGGWVDAYVAEMGKSFGEGYAPSGYLEVARDGEPVITRAWGFSVRETKTAPDGDTRFRIGSLTKQFTAACILQLVEHGQVKVEDPIRKYLPDWPAATGDVITLHHLLTHTSGLPSYTDDPALMKDTDKPHTREAVLSTFRDKPLQFEPGKRFEYSNSNYFVLGTILEKVTGQPYEAYVLSHVLTPAKMTRTTAGEVLGAPGDAVGYVVGADESIVPAPPVDMSVPFAAGEIRSTANDLVAWDIALRGNAVLSDASKQRMITPEKSGYAYGLVVKDEGGHTVIGHNGGINGFKAGLYRVPDLGLVIVALSNNEAFSADNLGRVVMKMAVSGEAAPPVPEPAIVPFDPAALAALAGSYALDATTRKDLESKLPKSVIDDIAKAQMNVDGGRLFLKPGGQDPLGLFLGQDGALFSKHEQVRVELETAVAHKVPGFTLVQGALRARYVRAR